MVAQTASPHLPPAVQPVRAVVWVLHLAIPMAGLWLLLAQPPADVRWQHAVSHFWLVFVVAAVNIVLGVRMSVVAHQREDARLFLVSLAFLASAGFFLLHALATPGMVVHHPNLGFDLAQPVGLTVAALFAVWSALNLDGAGGRAVLKARIPLQAGLAALVVVWGVVSVLDLRAAQPAAGRAGGRRAAAVRGDRDGRPLRRRRGALLPPAPPQAGRDAHQHHHRVRAAGRVDGRGDPGPQVAAVLVGVARPARAGVRLRRLQRLRPVPARGLQRRPLRRDLGRADRAQDQGGVRRRARGPRHRAARRRLATGRSPRGWANGST